MKIRRFIQAASRILLLSAGVFFLVLLILSFTTLPFYARHWLGTHLGCVSKEPDVIVLMGGAGIPSDDGLLRTYFTALLASRYPRSQVIIAFPGDTLEKMNLPFQFKSELVMRGIDHGRIRFENTGRNTRQQAMLIAGMMLPDTSALALVTSPEHMYRSILVFRKLGFNNIEGFPTSEVSIDDRFLTFDDKDLKGNRNVPPIGHNKQVRYQFWNHLEYEILVIRELFALGYYKLRSWI